MSGAASCRSCGAAVVWAMTQGGKPMPVDAEPAADGNLVVVEDVAGELRVFVASGRDWPGEPRYRPHFATCPDAERWRR